MEPATVVVGAGRVGLSLARALVRSGTAVTVCTRSERTLPPPLSAAATEWTGALSRATIVVLSVPDDAIPAVAGRLADLGVITAGQVVLHCSGLLDRQALAPLVPTGAALGSWHPLQTLTLPAGDPDALVGSPAIIEGDPRAVAAARELAGRCRMAPIVEIPAESKPGYHAAAVFASNYLVVLAAVAKRLAREAGLETDAALFHPLMARTVANLASADPAAVLTGPIRRGDAGTVQAHLDALGSDTRALYLALAREAMRLAEQSGVDVAAVRRVVEEG
ncbi:MAG: Rossmann-like and DUF2520 domain-containing protein [Gemmatimonadales bacterium]|nr:Rossmann-like and DUF2520 domain-containing protein [Gemmatimonadales bacterium]